MAPCERNRWGHTYTRHPVCQTESSPGKGARGSILGPASSANVERGFRNVLPKHGIKSYLPVWTILPPFGLTYGKGHKILKKAQLATAMPPGGGLLWQAPHSTMHPPCVNPQLFSWGEAKWAFYAIIFESRVILSRKLFPILSSRELNSVVICALFLFKQ